MKRKTLSFAAALAVVIVAALYVWGPSSTPQAQQPLFTLSSPSLSEFQTAFDAMPESPRLVFLLSPT